MTMRASPVDRRLFLTSLASTALVACSGGANDPAPAIPFGASTRVHPLWSTTKVYAGAAFGISIDSTDGLLYVATGPKIQRIAPDGTMTQFGFGARWSRALAIDSQTQTLYVADLESGTLWRYNARVPGSNGVAFARGVFVRPCSMVFDAEAHAFYFLEERLGTLMSFTLAFDLSQVASGYRAPRGVAIDTITKTLYVADYDRTGIDVIGTDGKQMGSVGPEFQGPTGVARHRLGDLFVADDKGFYQLSDAGTVTTIAATGGITAVAVDEISGAVYAASSEGVYKFTR